MTVAAAELLCGILNGEGIHREAEYDVRTRFPEGGGLVIDIVAGVAHWDGSVTDQTILTITEATIPRRAP